MKKLAILSILLMTASVWAGQPLKSAPLNSSIQKALNECNASLKNGAEYVVACPTFEKFTYTSEKGLKDSIESLKYLTLTQANAQDTLETITSRMKSGLSYMKESGQYSNEVIQGYENSIEKISAIITSMSSSKNAENYIDPDTYWAPSVNADAAVVINKDKKTVYVIMMGDTDG